MQISTNLDGLEPEQVNNLDFFHYQLLIEVKIGINEEIKVVFRSASRDDTSYEIFDGTGSSMGERRMRYATGRLNVPLVDDLNVLLEEHGVSITYSDFRAITDRAVRVCESRYGNGNNRGDVIITIL